MRATRQVAALCLLLLVACGSPGSARPPAVVSFSPLPASATPSPQPSLEIPPIPAGAYTRTVIRADALRAHMCAEDIEENTGTTVLTIGNGRFKWKQTADHPIFNPFGEGIYYVFDGGVKFASATNAPEYDVLSWRFDGKALHFKVIEVVPDDSTHCHLYAARAGWESHPWKKTG